MAHTSRGQGRERGGGAVNPWWSAFLLGWAAGAAMAGGALIGLGIALVKRDQELRP